VPAVAGPGKDVRGQLLYVCRAHPGLRHRPGRSRPGCRCRWSWWPLHGDGAEEAGVHRFGRPARQRGDDALDDRRAQSGQRDDCLSCHVVSVEQVEHGLGEGTAGTANSFAALERVHLGGSDQGILERSEDVDNPAVLYLHGGPGTSQFTSKRRNTQHLEEFFNVVIWDNVGQESHTTRSVILTGRTLTPVAAARRN